MSLGSVSQIDKSGAKISPFHKYLLIDPRPDQRLDRVVTGLEEGVGHYSTPYRKRSEHGLVGLAAGC